MAKRGKATAVPTMRFPGFRSETWEAKALGSVSDIKTGPFGSTLHQSDYVDVGTPIVTVEHLSDYGLVHANLPLVSDKDRSRLVSYALKAGDIVFSRVGSVDRNSLVGKKEDGWLFSGRLLRIRTDVEKVNPAFLSFYFQLEGTKQTIRSVAVGQTMPSLNTEILNAFPVVLTTLPEQLKIADCLTSLDEVIAAQGRNVEALKAHKRGLMQQLFPREGETRPRLRFPEFRDAPEWKEKKLGDITTIVRGGSPRPIDGFLTSSPDGLNWLKIGDVDRETMFVTKTADKVRPDALSKTRVIQPGDFILSNSMSFGRPYISAIETCIHDGWIAVTRIPDSLGRKFLYYSILSERSQAYFVDQAAGGGVQNLNKDIIKSLVLGMPAVEEQQRIADCLSSLDTRITAETQQLAALKTHKQGLMQQLFPVAESVAA